MFFSVGHDLQEKNKQTNNKKKRKEKINPKISNKQSKKKIAAMTSRKNWF